MFDTDELFVGKLPDKLNENELKKLLISAKGGDSLALNKIIVHNVKLIIKIEKRYSKCLGVDRKDLLSSGVNGLIKAVNKYDLDLGVSFSTFASRCINTEMSHYLRKRNSILKREISLDECIYTNDDSIVSLKDIIEDEFDLVDNFEKKELIEELKKHINELSERDKKIIELYFGFSDNISHSQFEISSLVGTSQSNVSKIIILFVKKMRNILYSKGFIESIPNENKKIVNNTKPIQTIYELLSNYSKEEIDNVINNLDIDDLKILRIRYGNDLEKRVSFKLNEQDSSMFYGYLIPKIKKLLSINRGEERKEKVVKRTKKSYESFYNPNSILPIIINKIPFMIYDSTNLYKYRLTEDDCNNIVKVLYMHEFYDSICNCNSIDVVCLALKVGYYDMKYFSDEEIAVSLNISISEVENSIKKVLSAYRNFVSSEKKIYTK